MKKKIIPLLSLIFAIALISSVFALTGSLGNARMVIRANVGDSIEKYVLVKNVNDIPVKIGLKASGDLADSIILKENEFLIEPGGEKKAYFTIKVQEEGTTESRIEVTFSSDEQKNGVGLTSTIIVIAGKDTEAAPDENSSINGKTIAIVITSIILIVLLIVVYFYFKNKKTKIKEEIKFKKSAETK